VYQTIILDARPLHHVGAYGGKVPAAFCFRLVVMQYAT
jgi:hypothetical protein